MKCGIRCHLLAGAQLEPVQGAAGEPTPVATRAEAMGRIELPELEEVARGIGEVLARMHSAVGVDAGDVELVLGGTGTETGVQCYVLDYNQVRCQSLSFSAQVT